MKRATLLLLVCLLAHFGVGRAEQPSCLEEFDRSVAELKAGLELEIHVPALDEPMDENRCRQRYRAYITVLSREIALHVQRRDECAELRKFLDRQQSSSYVASAIQARLDEISRTCDVRHLDIFSIAPWSPFHPSLAYFRPADGRGWIREARVTQKGSMLDVSPWQARGSVNYATYE